MAKANFTIEPVSESQLPQLARIYRSAIEALGAPLYSPEQIGAWAGFADDAESFKRWIEGALTLAAVGRNRLPSGFGGLEPQGRISSLFVQPDCMRQGIGSALLRALITKAEGGGHGALTTEASEFSKPLFEKFGFAVETIEHTTFRNVRFTRYAMRRRTLIAHRAPPPRTASPHR